MTRPKQKQAKKKVTKPPVKKKVTVTDPYVPVGQVSQRHQTGDIPDDYGM